MSFTLGRVLHSFPKSFISDRIFSFTTITSLHFANHNDRISNHANKIPCRKILQPLQVHQHRYFSIDFNDSLYQTVTTNEAIKFITDLLIKTHDLSGLHWWGTLVAAPVFFKLIYGLPCAIYQHKLNAKTELVMLQTKPLIEKIKEEIMIEGRQKMWPPERMQRKFRAEASQLTKKVVMENNIHPFKSVILSLVQLPPWILLTMSVSKLGLDAKTGRLDSVTAALQYQVGGPSWCRDLSAPDPMFILPTALFILTLVNFEMNWILKPLKNSTLLKVLKVLSRVLAGLFFFIAINVQSGLSMCWTANVVFTLAQNLFLHSPRVRRMLRIPKTPSELEKPYSHLVNQMRNKLTGVFSKK